MGIKKSNDMSFIFSNCISLGFLPNISQWNTFNTKNMKALFKNCSSLPLLPDLSKWNTDNVNDLSELFSGCPSISKLPDLSNGRLIMLLILVKCFIIVI